MPLNMKGKQIISTIKIHMCMMQSKDGGYDENMLRKILERNIVSIFVIFIGMILSFTGYLKTQNFTWGYAIIGSGLISIILDFVNPSDIDDLSSFEYSSLSQIAVLIAFGFIFWLILVW